MFTIYSTKIFSAVNNDADRIRLQNDLDKLLSWAEEWQMLFNVIKCKVMHIGHRNSGFRYCMNGTELDTVDREKDLGIIITRDLKVSQQCKQAYSKANQMLGALSRTIRSKDKRILLNLYKSVVRPHLEYCTSSWSPHYVKEKELLEKVQHRFTRMFSDLRKLPYLQRLRELKLWTLEKGEFVLTLLKFTKSLMDYQQFHSILFFEFSTNTTTKGHSLKLAKRRVTTDLRLHFFSERVINIRDGSFHRQLMPLDPGADPVFW